MPNKDAVVPEEQHFILSTLAPSPAQKRLALAIVLGVLAVYLVIVAGPLRGVHPGRLDAFIPAYVSAMFVNDLITAILLYAQFSILRSRAILVIASGYLFTALMLIPYILVFPSVFVPGNMVGGGQSTSWVYFLAHAHFSSFRHRLCLLERCGSPQTNLAGDTARSNCQEFCLDGGARCRAGIFLHRGPRVIAARDSRCHAPERAVALCWSVGGVVQSCRHRRALGSRALGARSMVDGRSVLNFHGQASELLP